MSIPLKALRWYKLIDSYSTDPGKHPQAGKLIGTSIDETVIELKDGVRLHFPRVGYIVRDQKTKW